MDKKVQLKIRSQIAQHESNILSYEAKKIELQEKIDRLDGEINSQANAIKVAKAKLAGE